MSLKLGFTRSWWKRCYCRRIVITASRSYSACIYIYTDRALSHTHIQSTYELVVAQNTTRPTWMKERKSDSKIREHNSQLRLYLNVRTLLMWRPRLLTPWGGSFTATDCFFTWNSNSCFTSFCKQLTDNTRNGYSSGTVIVRWGTDL